MLDGIIASLKDDALLIPEAHQYAFQRNIGGSRASVAFFRSRTVVGGVPITRLKSAKLLRAEVHFLGLGIFSGISAVNETHSTDSRGRGTGYLVEVRGTETMTTPIPRGRVLGMGTTWSTAGATDAREVLAPIAVSCTSSRPRPAPELFNPLLHIQDLISFSHTGVIKPVSGTAHVHVEPDPRDEIEGSPKLWQGQLMTTNPGVPEAPANAQRLIVDMSALGGVPSLGRWSRLYDEHPRAVRPVIGRFRVDLPTAELLVMEVAAGIEYWVNVHKGTKWAAKRKGEAYVHALARHLGTAFAEFVGHPDRWANMFRETNNGPKHRPGFRQEEHVIGDIGPLGGTYSPPHFSNASRGRSSRHG